MKKIALVLISFVILAVFAPAGVATAAPLLTINTTNLAGAELGRIYSNSINISYAGSLNLAATWTGLPSGISGQTFINSAINVPLGAGTLVIRSLMLSLSGTPTQTGTFPITVVVKEVVSPSEAGTNAQAVATQNLTLIVDNGSVSARVGANVLMHGTVYYVAPAVWTGVAPNPELPQPQPTLKPYTSAAVFLSYGFNNWSEVLPISNTEALLKVSGAMPYADGTLVNDHGTVYAISGNTKHGIPSANIFSGLGYSWANVLAGDASFIPDGGLITTANSGHLPGTLVNINGTIYYVGGFTGNVRLYGIPSINVFNSWGFKFKNAVQPNNFDVSLLNSAGSGAVIGGWQQGTMLTPVPNQPLPE